jgi:hypothetical protein
MSKIAKNSSLTKAESDRLAACEKAIKHGLNTFVDVGQALTEIRDAKLYRAVHKTFDAYCKDVWNLGRSRAYELIDQAKVASGLASAGVDLSGAPDISSRDAAAIKKDIPAVADEIRHRIRGGEDETKAITEVIAGKRAERQIEWDRQREEARAALPDGVKQHVERDAGRAKAGTDLTEGGETIADLEAENAKLKAEIKAFADMRMQFDRGGFEQIIKDKDEQIRVLKTRVASESREKVKNLNAMEFWKKEAIKLGWSRDEVIDIDGLDEAAHG